MRIAQITAVRTVFQLISVAESWCPAGSSLVATTYRDVPNRDVSNPGALNPVARCHAVPYEPGVRNRTSHVALAPWFPQPPPLSRAAAWNPRERRNRRL